MPLKLARDLLQDRYARVLRRTLEVLMVALPVMLWFSIAYTVNTAQTVGVAIFTVVTYGLYLLLYLGHERWVGPMLIALLVSYTTWDIVAYGSVRSAGAIGYLCAVVAAGIMTGRRTLAAVILLCVALLAGLTWAEMAGIITRDEYSVSPTFWLSHVTALVGVAIGTATSRQQVQRAVADLQLEVERRTQAERELQRSEHQLRRVFELSPAGIVVQSVNTREILDMNPAFERIFGYTREEYIGTKDHTSLWMDPRQRNAMLAELLEHGRISSREIVGRRRDGKSFHALISSEIGGVGDERIIVSTIADTSVEVEARRSLQRSQELFRKAFDFSPMNMMISRASDGVFLAVNSAEGSVQGYTRDELLGRSAVDTGSWASEEQRLQFVERLRREGQVMRLETRMRHKHGHMVDCAIWAVIVDIDGEDCVLSCSLNMTEEKRREAVLLDVARGVSGETGESFFRQLTQSLAGALGADMVMVGEIDEAREVQTLALWSDGSVQANMRYALSGTPCDTAAGFDDMCSYLDRVHEIFPHDHALADGGFRAYMGMALRDPAGRPIGILAALWRTPQPTSADRDALVRIFASRGAAELIRLRHERQILLLNEGLEQRVAERTAELRATNAELESFAYSVSHDLQTPLRGIDGFTALLGQQLGDALSPEQQRMFGRVRINVARMGELIADLLGLAKVSKREMRLEMVDLSALAAQVGESLRQTQPGREIRISVAPGLHAECDRSLARIALENLLGNAVKYTRPREVASIEIGAAPGEQGVLYIRDNGVGFDMEYADKLFKPFTRLHHDHEFEGSGVGLATVHRILERHGGGITGSGRVDDGATFRFSFERMPAD
jgi:PAS domain S-box-containing protein